MLSDEKKDQLINVIGKSVKEYPCNESIMDIFERKAKECPQETALVYQDQTMTYRELNDRAEELAYYLTQVYRIKPQDIVGIMMERSFDLIIGIFGILKSGAAYLPIGCDYPESRIAYILENSRTPFVLVNKRPEKTADSVTYVNIHELPEESPDRDSGLPARNDQYPAYVLYTSGTTGKPKGVVISNANVVNMLYILQDFYPLQPQEPIILKTVYRIINVMKLLKIVINV